MLQYREQYRIVKNTYLSFKNDRISYTKVTDDELIKYSFYRHSRFESWTKANFKLLILFLFYKNGFNKTSCFKYLNETDLGTLKNYAPRDDILAYKNIIKTDIKTIEKYENNPQIVFSLYKQEKISFLGLYWFLYNNDLDSRILRKELKKLSLLLGHMVKIKQYIEGLK